MDVNRKYSRLRYRKQNLWEEYFYSSVLAQSFFVVFRYFIERLALKHSQCFSYIHHHRNRVTTDLTKQDFNGEFYFPKIIRPCKHYRWWKKKMDLGIFDTFITQYFHPLFFLWKQWTIKESDCSLIICG